jgi:membrane protein implicated in regulation of membrane protease activity
LNVWVAWIAGGLVLLGLEIIVPGAFLMWIGLGALGTGILVWLTAMGFAPQVVAFATLSAVSVVIGLRLRKPIRRLNTQTAGLVGRPATAIAFEGRTGRVRVGDSDWAARVPHDVVPPEAGAHLTVEGVDGTTLIVRPEKT